MSAEQRIYEAISGVMPCAHIAYKIGSAPKLPWCVYYLEDMSGFAADNRFQSKRGTWVVEHYWKDFDEEKRNALESSLEDRFGAFGKSEAWVDDEKCFMSTYRFVIFE